MTRSGELRSGAWTAEEIPDLDGVRALVTGVTSGPATPAS